MSAEKAKRQRSLDDPDSIRIERIFKAPRALVFETWTNPQYLMAWYAPRGCTIEYRSIDVRPGGRFHSCIHNPAFGDCWCVGEYLEIVVPERIVYTLALADSAGRRQNAAQTGHHPDWPDETLVSVSFEDLGDRTRLTLRQNAPTELAKQTGAYPSWLEMLDNLQQHLDKELSHAQS